VICKLVHITLLTDQIVRAVPISLLLDLWLGVCGRLGERI
jgi:hypothetical protein